MKTGWCASVLATAAMLGGCDNVYPIYQPTTGGHAGAHITPKQSWSARGTVRDVGFAIDDDVNTAARSDLRQNDAELVIDLKQLCLFQTVIIEHGSERDGHPRAVSVATSTDGKTFQERHVGPGTRRVTILSLPAPVLARYVRLKVATPGLQAWNVAEVYLQ